MTERNSMEKQSAQPPMPQGQIQVKIDPELEGTYANLVLLAHSPSEFILDFARLLPGIAQAKVQARIIMTPQNAKSLLRALEARVESYESQFGKIPGQGEPGPSRDIGFKTDTP
jgi:hypothetical protein